MVKPVTLPPGRARTLDKTVADRISDLDEHDRDSLGLPVRRRQHWRGACQDDAGA